MRIAQNPAVAALEQGLQISRPRVEGPGHADDFGAMLMDVLKQVDGLQQESRTTQQNFQTGQQKVETHDLMIALEKSSTAMALTLAVRNKLLEAYQEIARMQV